MRRVTVLLLALGTPILAQTPPPEALRTLLMQAREHPQEHAETRGDTPDLTRVKHYLRDWTETWLAAETEAASAILLENELNGELKSAGLTCNDFPKAHETKCPEDSLIGFLGDIKVRRSGEFLVFQTAAGIQMCGNDESAYIYQWNKDHWQRFWQNEQTDYREKSYLPQALQAVVISPALGGGKTEYLIVTVGVLPWCTSVWQPIYYRIWQVSSGGRESKLLLDESEMGIIDEPTQAGFGPDDVFIEYSVNSTDQSGLRQRQIRHYVVKQGKIERGDRVLLSTISPN